MIEITTNKNKMANEKFRDLRVGDIIRVYDHLSKKHYPAQIISIKGEGYDAGIPPKFGKYKGCSIEFGLVGRNSSHSICVQSCGSFYVNYSEEKSMRGSKHTGFLTEEDAEEFRIYLADQKINELKKEIEKLEKSK
jgi:hypothetical protein